MINFIEIIGLVVCALGVSVYAFYHILLTHSDHEKDWKLSAEVGWEAYLVIAMFYVLAAIGLWVDYRNSKKE